MSEFAASDFLNADMTIRAVANAYHSVNAAWARPVKTPRLHDGLLCFTAGAIAYEFEGNAFTARAGQVFKLPAGVPYSGQAVELPIVFHCVDFDTAEEGEFSRFPFPDCFAPCGWEDAVKRFEEIELCFSRRTLATRLDCKNLLGGLLSTLAKDYAVNVCGLDDRSRVMQISEFVRERSCDPTLRVSDIADAFHMSATHLRRLFAAEFHTSPADYLAAVRLENARRMLTGRRDLTVQEIASACGYASVYYFSAVFRASIGMTPTEYHRAGGAE